MNKQKFVVIGRFLAIFLLCFAALYLSSFLYANFFQYLHAFLQSTTWNFLGKKNFLKNNILHFENLRVEISFLCSGLIELFILISAIIATPSSRRKKIFGIVASLVLVFIFNFFRIFISTYFLFLDISFAELIHEILFRLSLFFVIAGVYYLWLRSENL